MGFMTKTTLTEQEIDDIVVADADELNQWESPVFVQPDVSATMSIPFALAVRAQFFAGLHKKHSMEEWLQAIIRERIDFEETAYAALKQTVLS
jgi:hypothetical protein